MTLGTLPPLTIDLSIGAGVMQLYWMMVCGPVFACVLTKQSLINLMAETSGRHLLKLCLMLVKLQLALLSSCTARHNCRHCGESDPHGSESEDSLSLDRNKVTISMDKSPSVDTCCC